MILFTNKEKLKEELKEELLKEVVIKLDTLSNDIVKILELDKKTDKELATEFKHTKFKNVSLPMMVYLSKRLNVKIYNCYDIINYSSSSLYYTHGDTYISDFIENILFKKQNSEYSLTNSLHFCPQAAFINPEDFTSNKGKSTKKTIKGQKKK